MFQIYKKYLGSKNKNLSTYVKIYPHTNTHTYTQTYTHIFYFGYIVVFLKLLSLSIFYIESDLFCS